MKLYFFPGSIAIASAIALTEAGIDFETQKVDFATDEQKSPAYAAINPKGRVPALIIGDHILTETGAILEYIAAQTPGLMPTDLMEAAHVRGVMFYLASTMHVNHGHKARGNRWADKPESHADMTAKVPTTMTASAEYVETECLRGTYILGDTACIADPYLFMLCSWLPGDGVDLEPFPKIRAFMAAMENRPSVKKMRATGML